MKKFNLYLSAVLLCVIIVFSGCGRYSEIDDNPQNSIVATIQYTTEIESTIATETTVEKTTEFETNSPAKSKISLSSIPSYSGNASVQVNDNIPFFSSDEYTTESFESYSDLDYLGRCGVAYACIGTDIMPTEKRGAIGMIKPSGWHTVRYDDLISDKYLYNRCHLIAYELSGENANEKNLITGTRYMNIEGMLPYENKVHDYVERTSNHVMYRSTPVFENDNLVATGVLLEGYSVEDSGSGISFCVYCYNVQPGIEIDYATGDSHASENAVKKESNTPKSESTVEKVDNESDGNSSTTYILNTNTKKFHYPTCSSVSNMKEKNKKEYSGTRDEVISLGYSPCGKCNP